MRADDVTISDQKLMVEAQNYRQWMYRRIAPFLGRRILEVGAGIGNFTTLLLDRELVVALDAHPLCTGQCETRFGDTWNVLRVNLDIADPAALALDRYKCDTVLTSSSSTGDIRKVIWFSRCARVASKSRTSFT